MSPRAGLDKNAVVQAAARLVDTAGLDALSISRLAHGLGIQAPSIYNHVGGLPGLRRELALAGYRDLARHLGDAAIGRSGPDALLAVAGAYRAYIKEHPGIYAAGLRASGNQETVDEELVQAEERLLHIVMRIIHSFGLTGEDAIHAARGLRSLVHGFATLENSGGFGLPISLDKSFQRLIQLLILGMQQQVQSVSHSSPQAV